MGIVRVGLGAVAYRVIIEPGVLSRVGGTIREACLPSGVHVVSNPTVWGLYGAVVEQSLREAGLLGEDPNFVSLVPDAETAKSLTHLSGLYDDLVSRRLDRAVAVVAVGGGVVGDLAGLAAATYLRGVALVQVPTTLLAQVDASVGGKVAIDHREGKNLIGAFHHPRAVVVDPSTLATLAPREFAAGMAEVIKHALIADEAYLRFLEEKGEDLRGLEPGVLERAITRSVEIKAAVVGRDEREAGPRALLNLGHTIGHGVEAATGYGRYRHGEAVAVGIVGAAWVSARMGLAAGDLVARVESVLAKYNLPTRLAGAVPASEVLAAMGHDKKRRGERLRWVLLRAPGDPLYGHEVPAAVAREALSYLGAAD